MLRHSGGRSDHPGESSVAPYDIVWKDLDMLRSRDLLRTTRDIEELILLQSMEGRAHAGHGQFRGRRFVNTTEDDLARALHMDPEAVRRRRQGLISEIVDWAQRAMSGKTDGRLTTDDYTPLLGIGTFAFIRADPVDVLRGLYLGCLRDTLEVREETERRYGVGIGGGSLYRVDCSVMHRMGLDGAQLAQGEHGSRIDEFRRLGLITETPPAPHSSVRYMYIRHHRGTGASDDAAIVAGGLRWGGDTAIGVFLADAIDTLEKYVPAGQEGDQDAALGHLIGTQWKKLDVGFDEVCELTFLATGGEGIPDSSLRHLLRVDRNVDQCALEAHLLMASGQPYPPMELGHEHLPNHQFYAMVEGRVERNRSAVPPGSRTRH